MVYSVWHMRYWKTPAFINITYCISHILGEKISLRFALQFYIIERIYWQFRPNPLILFFLFSFSCRTRLQTLCLPRKKSLAFWAAGNVSKKIVMSSGVMIYFFDEQSFQRRFQIGKPQTIRRISEKHIKGNNIARIKVP